ncbi:MAG: TldD/PmbA family protein [Candidatus Cryptobacteroides sp.]
MYRPKEYYTDLFQVDVPQLEKLAGDGLERGGDYCDLYFENTVHNDLLLRDGIVSSGGLHIDYGVGIRVLEGEKTGYAYSESTDAVSMSDAARAASMIAGGRKGSPKALSCRQLPLPEDVCPWKKSWAEETAGHYVPYMERLRDLVFAKEPKVSKVMVMLQWQTSDILMFNSAGELSFDTRPLASLSVSAVFSKEGRNENNNASRSFRMGSEMLSEELLEGLAEDVARGIDDRFEARRPKGGRMPVVMGAGASGILLHEAMGHAFEADFNRKGQSVFSDRMGTRICGEGISIVDDGTLEANRGAVNFDDEGVPGQKTYMVRDGILTSYLHDRISAGFYGVAPTGNGRRESFRYAPIPRMRATYMESGNAAKEDIIASVKKGIYVDEFSNGQVQIGEGDFTFFVKSGYLIENGRLTRPVKDINIIGNGPQALSDIVAVGNDLKIDNGTWTCGKGQSCPVSQGIPTVLIKNLTVGGE